MTTALLSDRTALKEILMRFAPAAAALALALAVTASVGSAAERKPDPRAATLIAEGQAALAANNPQGASEAFEAALAVDPGYTPVLIELGKAAQASELPGKAIYFYREAIERDPASLAAISGEGAAMAQKGAIEKARANLAKIESLCGQSCPEARSLAAAIAAGPSKKVMTAEATATTTAPDSPQNN